ncbi:iron-sulfur cluster repair di-iron protein [Paenibacillus larvae]|uniref:iron-sulfur cluster repair di-iron protein n=1 Tax=Paenibacillus larvae TaxID=1464 RepID=UPI002853FD6A|nr:iron-sulfur cluster repair di-iron protein [Paenibacillus larvae]MDR5584358.1 iron-sulfur cluster repair di-iron protein [Paenibacillus larvae]MDR5598571.1 iron-sulfur cluster repair di-iron protein [Paenibacillus larvae]
MTFTAQSKIRDIVIQFPKASDYFKTHKIDFCCGGNKPLEEVAKQHGLDVNDLLRDIQHLQMKNVENRSGTPDPAHLSSTDLIDLIVDKHHAYLREELPQLDTYVTKVFHVHGKNHVHLQEVFRLFRALRTELEQHTLKEETISFPQIQAYENKPSEESRNLLADTIRELEKEHDEAGHLLKEIRRVTSDFTLPEGACTTYQITYHRLEELESMTFEHVHLENNILFPRYTEYR